MNEARHSIGLDFGTESVRAVVVNIRDGRVAGQGVVPYRHGVLDREVPGVRGTLPPDFALQHPADWLDAVGEACRKAINESRVAPEEVVGIGVDFTSCTVLPARRDGSPLCLVEPFGAEPHAWPKLWKHHGAKAETDRINAVARERNETWLNRYGGTIGLEWFFPKVLEVLNHAPSVYDAADLFIEAGDWLVWQLTTGPYPRCDPTNVVRSTCQAGYKALWNRQTGYPSEEYFAAVHPRLRNVVNEKLPGTHRSPGCTSGALTERAADLLGLREGIPVSTAIIDAHAGVPGAGVASPSTLVMAMGASSCHMLNSRVEKLAPGIAGVVEEGILPGYFGYETGQASVGDAFAWVAGTVGLPQEQLDQKAAQLPPGSGGVMAVNWLNGCRTPLMDGRLSGAFVGVTLGTRPEQLYRAMMEATAFDLRRIVETLRDAGVPVRRFCASGGLPAKSPLLMQIYADVLDARIHLPETDQPVAMGAAILGCIASGSDVTGYAQVSQAIHAMSRWREDLVYRPDLKARKAYGELYRAYRTPSAGAGEIATATRELRSLSRGDS